MALARGDSVRARTLLERCPAEHPRFFGSVLPYATTLLVSGVEPDEVCREVTARVHELTPTTRFMLGTALFECGRFQAAGDQFRALLERQPHNAPARVALGESLLALSCWADAAKVAAAIEPDNPLAPAAAGTELFALIVAGELDNVRSRVREAPLAESERSLFDGWHALTGGEEPASALPASSVGLLATVLEALLRVQEFDAFQTLVGLLERVPMAARERRELLATIHLRRGYLASAAEEWMAIATATRTPGRWSDSHGWRTRKAYARTPSCSRPRRSVWIPAMRRRSA